MPNGVPTNANEFIVQQLHERLTSLENAFDCSAISLTGPLVAGVDDLVRTIIEEVAGNTKDPKRLCVILTTDGGYIETVQRIAETIRHHFDHVAFIVPNYAFSAGTVLVMSGDQIFMDYYSRLGPIDPQVPTDRGRMVPALGYLVQWERLLQKAQDGTLTVPEAQLMLAGFDQAELYKYEQARELSVTLLVEWLVKYKFKNWIKTETKGKRVNDKMRQERAEQIARDLNNTDKWHSHGYGISMTVLRNDLNLVIDDLDSEQALNGVVRDYFGLLQDYMEKLGQAGTLHSSGRYLSFF